jgi:hypothetical protein
VRVPDGSTDPAAGTGEMPAFRRLRGLRVVADPAALDAALWSGEDVVVLRIAPDDAFAVDAIDVAIDDAHAVVEPEIGFSGAWVELDAIRRHAEWAIPKDRPALAQGNVATVPAKVWLPDADEDGGLALLITAAAYADELAGRLR